VAKQIGRSTLVEDLIHELPGAVEFMVKKGLPCFVCGEPTWGTFEEMARRSGKSEAEIDLLVTELQAIAQKERT
jgi:hypothetical protein